MCGCEECTQAYVAACPLARHCACHCADQDQLQHRIRYMNNRCPQRTLNVLGCHYMHTRIYTHTCIAHSDVCILTCMLAWMSTLDIGLVRELAWGRAPVHASTDDAPGWCDSNILVCLVEEGECLRVEGRGKPSCAKREPEGVPATGLGHAKGWKKRRKIKS